MKACFVVLFAVVIVAVNAACNRVDVNVSNSSEFENALLKAQPGHNIILANAAYYASNNKQFNLKASGVEDCPIVITCKIQGTARLIYPLDTSQSSFVNISNISVTDFNDDHGLRFNGCSDITIENVHVGSFDGRGLLLTDSKYVTVRNCTFDNLKAKTYSSVGQRAIDFSGTSQSTVERCTFGNYIDGTRIVFFDDCSYNVISENIFYGKASGSRTVGSSWIDFSGAKGCAHNEISRNFFENPDGQITYEGIDVTGDSTSLIKENLMIFNNGKYIKYAIKVGKSQAQVCASNRIFGTSNITDGSIDPSC